MKEFAGRVAVVTGAASGIGRALARRFAALEMKVVLADVDAKALDAAASEVAASGAAAIGVVTDVSRADSVAALADRAVEAFGGVHLVCNNAGVFSGGASWDIPLSDYEWVLGVNLWGVIHGIRSFVPLMLDQGQPGHVVNTASMAAVTATPFTAPYCASKHAVLSLSETLHLELRARSAPIGVSVVCPELVDTRIGDSERNRPERLRREAGRPPGPERELVENALRASVRTGIPPSALAERVVEAVRCDRLYVLSDPGDPWREACNARLEDLRLARNPSAAPPGSE